MFRDNQSPLNKSWIDAIQTPQCAEAGKRGLYENICSFAELEDRISALGGENSKTVGDAFEVFVEAYIATHQKLQAEDVWLVGQLPPEVRNQLNLPNDAKGIDGLFRTRTGELAPYQVKFRSRRAYLTFTEVAPFLAITERATDRVIFTNSDELAADVKNRDAMRTVSYTVEAFQSAADFLASRVLPETACLVTDVNMPGMTGVELHRHLVDAGYAIPTILVTAYPDEVVRDRALKHGVVCYLRKPVDDNDLERCLRLALQPDAPTEENS